MGRKKFRFVVRKNEERKKYTAATSLAISIPKTKLPAQSLSSLECQLCTLKVLPSSWTLTTSTDEGGMKKVVLCSLETARDPPIVRYSVTIREDFTWVFSAYGYHVLSQFCRMFSNFPVLLQSVDEVVQVVSVTDVCKVCEGNADAIFLEVAKRRDGVFKDHSGTKAIASVDSTTFTSSGPTIRHSGCEILLSADARYARCQQCSKYRKSLYTFSSRLSAMSDDRLEPSSHTTYASLTSSEKDERMRNLHYSVRQGEKQLEYWREKLDEVLEKRGVCDDSITADLHDIMTVENKSIIEEFPEGSFARVFWQQQLEAASKKSKRAMRWDPLMVKWCIYLRHKSSGAYELLRDSGCISLPSQRTLRDYTHYINANVGFSTEVDEHLAAAAKLNSCEEFRKCVIMLMDEMYIKEELIYDKHTGALIGFVNLGNINAHLLAFEHSINKSTAPAESLATTMMLFMVQGLLSSLSFPYAQFPCCKVTGQLLFDPFWEAIFRLERMGFKVLGVTFDGASVNRRLIKIHDPSKDTLLHKVSNPYASDGRDLLFFSDPPHLIKTTRNCWASKARCLWNNGKYILWDHLTVLYEKVRLNSQLTLIPKLHYEHLHLTGFSKMRVDLAAQVLSGAVCDAFLVAGGPGTEETFRFVSAFDKFFDCLNVGNFTDGRKKRKEYKEPYRSGNDFRLTFLESEFLPYLDKWEDSVLKRDGDFEDGERKRMMLSAETLLGIRITTHSFIKLVQYLFTLPGVTVFLSQKICQDPVENFFGCQRQRGGTHENPTVAEFCKNTQALRVIGSFCRQSVRGNCRGSKSHEQIHDEENMPLPKRRRVRVSKKK